MSDKTPAPEHEHLIGFDLETEGLSESGDGVLEVFARFGKLDSGQWSDVCDPISFVVPIDPTRIAFWHIKVLEMHSKNGLLVEGVAKFKELAQKQPHETFFGILAPYLQTVDRTLANQARFSAGTADTKWTLLGNSVHFDLRFVRRLFPEFTKTLTHRCFDISAIRMFCESLGMPHPEFPAAHRAGPDVQQSLDIYAHCRDWVLAGVPQQ